MTHAEALKYYDKHGPAFCRMRLQRTRRRYNELVYCDAVPMSTSDYFWCVQAISYMEQMSIVLEQKQQEADTP